MARFTKDKNTQGVRRLGAGQEDPVSTRPAGLAHPGTLAMGVGGIVFVAYVLNVGGLQVGLDDFFRNLDANIHLHDAAVEKGFLAVLPMLGAMLVVVVLYGLLRGLGSGARRAKKERRLRQREVLLIQASRMPEVDGNVFIRPVGYVARTLEKD